MSQRICNPPPALKSLDALMPLVIDNLCKRFGGRPEPAVCNASFAVEPGEILALVGPSGCGKTTTLRILAGLLRADHGLVRMDDRVWQDDGGVFEPPERRRTGFVFQDHALFPHLSVLGNVTYGLHGRRQSRRERRDRARAMLDMVGLENFDDRRVQELSGGQQQRVALARAVAPEPRVLLMDEPFSNLDAPVRASIRDAIRRLVEQLGLAAVLVTHDQEDALSAADRVAVMRDGEIQQAGRPEGVYRRPATAFVAGFLGRTNLLPADADGQTAKTRLGPIELDRAATGRVLVSLRPEHLSILMEPDHPAALPVTGRAFKGHDITYTLKLEDGDLCVQTDAGCLARVGDRVRVRPTAPGTVVENR